MSVINISILSARIHPPFLFFRESGSTLILCHAIFVTMMSRLLLNLRQKKELVSDDIALRPISTTSYPSIVFTSRVMGNIDADLIIDEEDRENI